LRQPLPPNQPPPGGALLPWLPADDGDEEDEDEEEEEEGEGEGESHVRQ
jgi:hypothetical protein